MNNIKWVNLPGDMLVKSIEITMGGEVIKKIESCIKCKK